jgi:hypothetical protein
MGIPELVSHIEPANMYPYRIPDPRSRQSYQLGNRRGHVVVTEAWEV